MQISDGGKYLNDYFLVGHEIESYSNVDELIEKVEYFLEHKEERERIALNGFKRVQRDYKIGNLLHQLAYLINDATGSSLIK